MTTYVPVSQLDDTAYRRRIRAWTLYDWANSAFATTILAAVLPVYYSQVAGATLPSAAIATQYWSVTLSISTFIVAILSPILGTVSDVMRGKKRFLSIFVTIGVIGTGFLILVDTGDWLLASIFFIVGRVGFGAANVFYDALLPHVARDEDQDRVSTQGYAFGYLGGGLLLAINVVMIFTLPDNWGVRLSLFSVAIWWAVFSLPIFREVPEPPAATEKLAPGESILQVTIQRIVETLRQVRQYRELFKFLIAFLIYNDGIGIVISIAAVYGAELGFGATELILAIMLVQFVGIPYSLVFGNLPSARDRRQTRFVAFVVFNIVALPIVALAGKQLLPQTLTGTPSPPFTAVGEAVGQGAHDVTSPAFSYTGDWGTETIPGAVRGESCAWYAFWCDEAGFDQLYRVATGPGAALNFSYNGQVVEVTHSVGPEHGIWAVEIDGAPVLDEDGRPLQIDAYNPTLRYGEQFQVQAEAEGTHVLTLTSLEESSGGGNNIAVTQVEVLQPLRTSSLPAIIGLLLGLQIIALLFAFFLGPLLFQRMADWLDTKRSIFLALIAYMIVAIWGYFLNSVLEFWFLAWMVAIVQGGSQALSRSLYAALSPKAMSGEFFGLFSIMSRFASVLSPILFVLAVAFFASSRPGVLSLIFLFGAGMLLLTRVDVAEGKRVARERDAALLGNTGD